MHRSITKYSPVIKPAMTNRKEEMNGKINRTKGGGGGGGNFPMENLDKKLWKYNEHERSSHYTYY